MIFLENNLTWEKYQKNIYWKAKTSIFSRHSLMKMPKNKQKKAESGTREQIHEKQN